jgi:hypothetical protein
MSLEYLKCGRTTDAIWLAILKAHLHFVQGELKTTLKHLLLLKFTSNICLFVNLVFHHFSGYFSVVSLHVFWVNLPAITNFSAGGKLLINRNFSISCERQITSTLNIKQSVSQFLTSPED